MPSLFYVAVSTIIGIFMFDIIAPFCIYRIPSESMIVAQPNTPDAWLVDVFPNGALLWAWDGRLRGNEVISYRQQKIEVEKNFLAGNGQLAIHVYLEIPQQPEAYVILLRMLNGKTLPEWVDELVEKFAQHHANNLNHLSESQQEQQDLSNFLINNLPPQLRSSGSPIVRVNLSMLQPDAQT